MRTCVALNEAVQPASHSFPMDTSELWVRPHIIWASRAAGGSWVRASVQSVFMEVRKAPFGRPTIMGVFCVPVV